MHIIEGKLAYEIQWEFPEDCITLMILIITMAPETLISSRSGIGLRESHPMVLVLSTLLAKITAMVASVAFLTNARAGMSRISLDIWSLYTLSSISTPEVSMPFFSVTNSDIEPFVPTVLDLPYQIPMTKSWVAVSSSCRPIIGHNVWLEPLNNGKPLTLICTWNTSRLDNILHIRICSLTPFCRPKW